MIENGYYTLLLNDKNTLVQENNDDVKVVDKDSIGTQDGKQQNKKQGDTKVDSKIVDSEQNDGTL